MSCVRSRRTGLRQRCPGRHQDSRSLSARASSASWQLDIYMPGGAKCQAVPIARQDMASLHFGNPAFGTLNLHSPPKSSRSLCPAVFSTQLAAVSNRTTRVRSTAVAVSSFPPPPPLPLPMRRRRRHRSCVAGGACRAADASSLPDRRCMTSPPADKAPSG